MSLEEFANAWSAFEASLLIGSAILSLYLFFKDPIRRWRFWGYRPTALIFLFSLDQSEMLLIKDYYSGQWLLPQGGVINDSIVATIHATMLREAGLDPYHYAISKIEPLQTLPLSEQSTQRKQHLGGISIFPELRGKGYIGCYLNTDTLDIKRIIAERGLTRQVKLIPTPKALKLLKESYRITNNPLKFELVQSVIFKQNHPSEEVG
jgi:hypothetical protein